MGSRGPWQATDAPGPARPSRLAPFISPPEIKANDARPEAATAAIVLGGVGIFARPLDRCARVAAAVVVGDRLGGLRLRGVMVSFEASLAGQGAFFGSVDSSGRLSDSGSRSADEQTSAGGARILAQSDGQEVTLTARVIREGYAQAAGPKSIRESIDVETEEIASQGESWPVRAGVRLTIYEKVENSEAVERRAPSPGFRVPDSPRRSTRRSAHFGRLSMVMM